MGTATQNTMPYTVRTATQYIHSGTATQYTRAGTKVKFYPPKLLSRVTFFMYVTYVMLVMCVTHVTFIMYVRYVTFALSVTHVSFVMYVTYC